MPEGKKEPRQNEGSDDVEDGNDAKDTEQLAADDPDA